MDLNKPVEKRRLHLREVADDDDVLPSYEGVGRDLRSARLNAGLERREVAVKLHIKQSYVHAIEDGKFEQFPASVYAYGFVRSYAELVELDEDLVIRQFKNEWEGLGTSTRLAFPEPPQEIRLPRGPLIVGSCLLAVAIYGGWYYLSHQDRINLPRVSEVPKQLVAETTPLALDKKPNEIAASVNKSTQETSRLTEKPAESVSPTASESQEKSLAIEKAVVLETAQDRPAKTLQVERKTMSESASVVPKVATAVAAAAPTNQPAKYGDTSTGRVTLRARADTWVQVQADKNDGQVFLGRILHVGDEFQVPDRADLFLMTGNAGGIEIMVDGKKVERIGSLGMVRRRVLLDPQRLIAGTAVDEN